MPHVAIQGMSTSGKSYLCHAISKHLKKQGYAVGVYEPVKETFHSWGNVDFITDDPQKFVWFAKRAHNAHMFCEECIDLGFKQNGQRCDANDLATRGRHRGLKFYFLGQRYSLIPPIVRENVETLKLFKCSLSSVKGWNEFFVGANLETAPHLKKYEFLDAQKYGETRRIKLSA